MKSLAITKILNLPVLDVSSGEKTGFVKEFIFNFEKYKISGFLVQTAFLKKNVFLPAGDIENIGSDAIMIKSKKDLKNINKKIKKDLKLTRKIKILHQKVITKSGEELGKMRDFFVDDVSFFLQKIEVQGSIWKSLFKGKLLIARDQIITIGQDAIIVEDAAVPAKKIAGVEPAF